MLDRSGMAVGVGATDVLSGDLVLLSARSTAARGHGPVMPCLAVRFRARRLEQPLTCAPLAAGSGRSRTGPPSCGCSRIRLSGPLARGSFAKARTARGGLSREARRRAREPVTWRAAKENRHGRALGPAGPSRPVLGAGGGRAVRAGPPSDPPRPG
jgi:hypothetical protein